MPNPGDTPPTDTPRPHLPRARGFVITLAVGLFTVMGEVSRLYGAAVGDQGRGWPLNDVVGTARLGDCLVMCHATGEWVVTDQTRLLTWFFVPYAVLTLLVAGVALHRVTTDSRHTTSWYALLVAILMVLETVTAVLTIRHRVSHPDQVLTGSYAAALGRFSALKWAVLLLGVLYWLRARLPGTRGRARRFWTAVRVHRYSVAAVLPIAVLTLRVGNGTDVFEQLPDVQRRWADQAWSTHFGWAWLLIAVIAVVLFVLGRVRSTAAWQQGRLPSGDAAPRPTRRPNLLQRHTYLLVWLAGPAIVAVGALTGHVVDITRAVVFVAVPLAVVLASFAVRLTYGFAILGWPGGLTRLVPDALMRRLGCARLVPRPQLDDDTLRLVFVTGDVLALLPAVVGGLGLLRSFTALMALPDGVDADVRSRAWLYAGFGTAFALAAWWLAERLLDRLDRGTTSSNAASRQVCQVLSPGIDRTLPSGVLWPLLLASLGLVYLLVSRPIWVSTHVGALASAELALLATVLLLGCAGTLAQRWPAPEVLRLPVFPPPYRLRSTPILTLFAVGLFVASTAAEDVTIHGVRGIVNSATTAAPRVRPSVQAAFETWLAAGKGCRLSPSTTPTASTSSTTPTAPASSTTPTGPIAKLPPGVGIRPMFVVAAEGGGIRAAYWTASALAAVGRLGTGGCAAHSTLLSSGASGGAVGLTVARFSGDPQGDVEQMADGDALAVGAIGLFVRDLVASSTGLSSGPDDDTVTDTGTGTGSATVTDGGYWEGDRASLMERSWQGKGAQRLVDGTVGRSPLAQPFLSDLTPTVTGQLVLNSTGVGRGCRVLVSQLDLSLPDAAPPTRPGKDATVGLDPKDGFDPAVGLDPSCDGTTGMPHSIDLFASYSARSSLSPALPTTGRPTPVAAPADTGRTVRNPWCLEPGAVRAATAAMLASRFPYVTPSGVVGPCGSWSRQQLVDGGYAENTGLGTLADLAPQWMQAVRRHNDDVLTAAAAAVTAGAAASGDLVVPVVIYLDNGSGSDLAPPPVSRQSELLVPPTTMLTAAGKQSDTPALLQRLAAIVADGQLATRALGLSPRLVAS